MKENKPVPLICPHCRNYKAELIRLQGSEELLTYNDNVTVKKELWQCSKCSGYFLTDYILVEITKLNPEIKNQLPN